MSQLDHQEAIDARAGVVGFWPDLQRFTISFVGTGGYDSQTTGILDASMPEAFRKQGMHVVFSGLLYQDATTPRPRLGGERVVWLQLRSIAALP